MLHGGWEEGDVDDGTFIKVINSLMNGNRSDAFANQKKLRE